MKLQVVIVNYNVCLILEQCLNTLERALKGIGSCIVTVIDNASTDNSRSYLPPRFPWVQFVWNQQNRGFAAACNQAIHMNDSSVYVLLLNPDTLLQEDTITRCLKFLDNHEETAAAGVRLFDEKGHYLPESMRRIPTLMGACGHFTGLGRLFPTSSWGTYYIRPSKVDAAQETEVLPGAFIMARREALKSCGGLDEDYFMYAEDIELSYQLRSKGLRLFCLPLAVTHLKGKSSNRQSPFFVRHFYGTMITFIRKHPELYPPYKALPAIFFIQLITSLRYLAIKIRAFSPKRTIKNRRFSKKN